MIRQGIFVALIGVQLGCAGLALGQPYRWLDDKGRVQFTDTPPPAGAKSVRKEKAVAPAESSQSSQSPAGGAVPFEVARAQKDFPVTLYTSPPCKEPCSEARSALNRRGVPFTEVLVWDVATFEKLRAVAGGADEVPVLTVGRSVQRGYEPMALESLLDSAGYPKAGAVPARAQAAPPIPEGYVDPTAREKPAAQPVQPRAPASATQRAGRYDPSGLQGNPPKPGRYGIPGETN
jgi:glutaredoxin